MSTTPAASPLRYATPTQMFFCLILFFMPWIEVQCASENARPTWNSTHSQSGMQIAAGWYALPSKKGRSKEEDVGPVASSTGWIKKQVERGEHPEAVGAAPVLWVYLGAASVAVVVGLVMPSNKVRMWILVVCCTAALFAICGEALVGFPVLEAVEKEEVGVEKPHKRKAVTTSELLAWAQSPAQFEKQSEEGVGVRVLYRVWFYIALVLPLGALLTALAEPIGLRATASGYVIPPQRIT